MIWIQPVNMVNMIVVYILPHCVNHSGTMEPRYALSFSFISTCELLPWFPRQEGGGPRVVVSTAAFHARARGSVPGLGGLKETKTFLPHPRVKVSIVGSLRDREVACSTSHRQGSNFESCVWRTASSLSSHHPQEVLLAQFSLYVHKGGLKPDSFHFPRQESAGTWDANCLANSSVILFFEMLIFVQLYIISELQ